METIIILIIVAIMAIYKNYEKNRSVGVIDWEKYKYYAYYKHLPADEVRRLMNAGFFTDQEETRKYHNRH